MFFQNCALIQRQTREHSYSGIIYVRCEERQCNEDSINAIEIRPKPGFQLSYCTSVREH